MSAYPISCQSHRIFWAWRDPQGSLSPTLKWTVHKAAEPMTLACSNQLSSSKPWPKIRYFLKVFQMSCLEHNVWDSSDSDLQSETISWQQVGIPELCFPPAHFIPLPSLHSRISDEEKQEVYLISACYLTLPKTQDTVGFCKCGCSPGVTAYSMHWRAELKMSDFS